MRLGSATHHTDTEQRHVELSFYPMGNRIRAFAESDPTIAPPGYYMLFIVDDQGRPCERASIVRLSHRRCRLITDRATFSVDEVAATGTTSFPTSFYVHLDGFLPSELGITTATPSTAQLASWAPSISIEDAGAAVAGITAVPSALHTEDPALPAGERQRLTFEVPGRDHHDQRLPAASGDRKTLDVVATKTVTVHGSAKSWTNEGTIALVRSANPYMLDGPTHWLSIDVRVFKVRNGADPFGVSTPVTDPTGYIQQLLADWKTLPTANHPFESIAEDQTDSALTLARLEGGQPVYNFAVARVRYRGRTLTASDVRVFFRLFSTANTNMTYDPGATYRRHERAGGQTVPLLGVRGGEVASIPFFAVPRIGSVSSSMEAQPEDTPNVQSLTPVGPSGVEEDHYFGAWLDINQEIARFPRRPGNLNGPFPVGAESIRDLVNGRHQCLVAEIHFEDDPIDTGSSPANSDNLSQRNLAIEGSDNPGGPAGHTLGLTFEIEPTWNVREAVGEWKTTALHAARGPATPDPTHDHSRAHDGPRDLEPHPAEEAAENVAPDPARAALDRGARLERIEALQAAAVAAAEDATLRLDTPAVAYRPGHHDHAAAPAFDWLVPDELMIDWGGLPTGTERACSFRDSRSTRCCFCSDGAGAASASRSSTRTRSPSRSAV